MSDKTYDVNFKLTVPEGSKWFDNIYDGGPSMNIHRIDPGPGKPNIVIPGDAEITQIANPVSDGFFVCEDSRTMYQRLDGKWLYWSDAYRGWERSSLSDEDVAEEDYMLRRIDVVA
jgi:hypothetical protein